MGDQEKERGERGKEDERVGGTEKSGRRSRANLVERVVVVKRIGGGIRRFGGVWCMVCVCKCASACASVGVEGWEVGACAGSARVTTVVNQISAGEMNEIE